MASFYKRDGSPFWWIKWRNPGTGKTERFSTGLRNFKDAEFECELYTAKEKEYRKKYPVWHGKKKKAGAVSITKLSSKAVMKNGADLLYDDVRLAEWLNVDPSFISQSRVSGPGNSKPFENSHGDLTTGRSFCNWWAAHPGFWASRKYVHYPKKN